MRFPPSASAWTCALIRTTKKSSRDHRAGGSDVANQPGRRRWVLRLDFGLLHLLHEDDDPASDRRDLEQRRLLDVRARGPRLSRGGPPCHLAAAEFPAAATDADSHQKGPGS